MASISSSVLSVSQIDSNTLMVQFSISTNVEPSIKFDLSTNHARPINLIVGPSTYSRMKQEFGCYKNSNSGEIKIFSYSGGKELCRIEPGSNQMGTVTYPEIQYSLLSQIQFPDIAHPNSLFLIVIDSYPALKLTEYSTIREKLIEQDTQVFNSKLKDFVSRAAQVGSTLQLVVDQSIGQILGELNLLVNITQSNETKITRCLGDILFGRVFGGTQPDFSSIISPGSGWDIVDAFSTNVSSGENNSTHRLAIRGSGLTIEGNCSSLIGIILKSNTNTNTETMPKLLIQDINLGIQLCDLDLVDLCQNPNASNLINYIKLEQYVQTLGQFETSTNPTNPELRKRIKEHVKANAEFIQLIEYGENSDWEIAPTDQFASLINRKICSLIRQAKGLLLQMRSHFVIESGKKLSFNCGGPLRQVNTVARREVSGYVNASSSNLFGLDTYDEWENGIANRQLSAFPNF
jgi:hypothetical protein